jgi:hypothetical protein
MYGYKTLDSDCHEHRINNLKTIWRWKHLKEHNGKEYE